jgi:hypothetical protein
MMFLMTVKNSVLLNRSMLGEISFIMVWSFLMFEKNSEKNSIAISQDTKLLAGLNININIIAYDNW